MVGQIADQLDFKHAQINDRYFVIDDTLIAKRGRNIDNVSFIYDHTVGRSILGFSVVTLGLFTRQNFYPLDFAYRFGKKRHPKSPAEQIGNRRSLSALMSYEAKHHSKIELALQMVQRAHARGIRAGYVLFDSWYSWPSLIKEIRQIEGHPHVICRLKDTKVTYQYRNQVYRLSALYRKVRSNLKKDARTGLLLTRATVRLPGAEEDAVIVFSKGYQEPEEETMAGTRKDKESKWVAFLCTETCLHASSIIKKYTKRWTVEVCFKECKQLLGLGKDHSNDFNAQVFSTMASFLRYNLLNFLNEKENSGTIGELFQNLTDESATITYAHRLWDFFRGLFRVAFSKIFDLFEIEEDFSSYLSVFIQALCASQPFQGCET